MGIGIGVGIGLWTSQGIPAVPTVKLSALTVAENVAAGTAVGTLSVANAPDGVTYTYALTSDPSGFFEIATATLQTAGGVDLDYETSTSHTIEVTATGSDASELVQSFVVSVTDVASGTIVVTYATPVEVADDAFAADEIVTFSAASDDSSDTFTYALQSDVSGNFEIVGNALRVATGASLVVDDVHSVTVRVSVPDGSYSDETFNVTVVSGGPVAADVFSTDLYTGNSSTQTITNGLDLAGKGGLVWLKPRDLGSHRLFDSARGATFSLSSDSTAASVTNVQYLTSFNSDGFSLGSNGAVNSQASTYASWSFCRAPRFFDIVTYAGDSVAGRTISHNLGVAPGMIIVKRRDGSFSWRVQHRSLLGTQILTLDGTQAVATNAAMWNSTLADDSVFTLGTDTSVNASGGTYVAYLFAHDPSPNGIIQCGSYTGNGSLNTVTLGWEPQWVMIKKSSGAGDWWVFDANRFAVNGNDFALHPNLSAAEDGFHGANNFINYTSTGFEILSGFSELNQSSGTYVYMAIRAEGA